MRFILALAVLVLGAAPVFAADEFGARFAGQAPSALGDPAPAEEGLPPALAMDAQDAAQMLNEILPAAGDEGGEIEPLIPEDGAAAPAKP